MRSWSLCGSTTRSNELPPPTPRSRLDGSGRFANFSGVSDVSSEQSKLIPCKTCQKQIADDAKQCPGCGTETVYGKWRKNVFEKSTMLYGGALAICISICGEKLRFHIAFTDAHFVLCCSVHRPSFSQASPQSITSRDSCYLKSTTTGLWSLNASNDDGTFTCSTVSPLKNTKSKVASGYLPFDGHVIRFGFGRSA